MTTYLPAVAASVQAIAKSRREGHKNKGIYPKHVGVMIAVYFLTDRAAIGHDTTAHNIWNKYNGNYFGGKYEALRRSLSHLVKVGYLTATAATYRGRDNTRYSLTIPASNFLTDIDKHMAKCKNPRKIKAESKKARK